VQLISQRNGHIISVAIMTGMQHGSVRAMLIAAAAPVTRTKTWINRVDNALTAGRLSHAVGGRDDPRTCRVREAETGVTVRNVTSNCLSVALHPSLSLICRGPTVASPRRAYIARHGAVVEAVWCDDVRLDSIICC